MCEIMRAELGEQKSDKDSPEEYRRLAMRLKRRRGNAGMLNLLHAMVGEAFANELPTPNSQPANAVELLKSDNWEVSETHKAIANIISLVPADRRGPIFTTNFDTLLETALHREDLNCQITSQPNNASIGVVGQHALPVIHLHGLWTDAAALNTDAELAWERDLLETQLAQSLDQTLLIAIGYGGWDDSFTRALKNLITEGYSRNFLEVIWISHKEPADSGLLVDLAGNPSVVEYVANIVDVADNIQYRLSDATRPDVSLPAGVRLIWPASVHAKKADLNKFVDGSHPEIEASSIAPRLKSSLELQERARLLANAGKDGAAILTGPLGDGKSVVIQQAAIDLAEGQGDGTSLDFQSPLVIEMQRGTQVPPIDFWAGIRSDFSTTFVMVDDADLVIEALLFRIRASRQKCLDELSFDGEASGPDVGNIVVIGAMHEQFRQTCRNLRAQEREQWELLRTETLSDSEVSQVYEFWDGIDATASKTRPPSKAVVSPGDSDPSDSEEGESLLGLLLTRWSGEGFNDRLIEIRARLGRSMIGEVSGVDVLDAVAILHHYRRGLFDGASLNFLAELTGLRNLDISRTVIRPLGREAAISRVGNIVIVRHEKIAARLVSIMPDARFEEMCARISSVGGRMRKDEIRGHECASLLCQRLLFPHSKIAAKAAFEASRLLESRVTYLKVLRTGGDFDGAKIYATGLREHYREYSDWEESWRGLFIESSVTLRALEDGKGALRLALLALSSLESSSISVKNLEFGLVNVIMSCRKINALDARELEDLARRILGRIPVGDYSRRLLVESTAPTLGQLVDDFILSARNFLRPRAPYYHDFKAVIAAESRKVAARRAS